jgi:diguanylate cyclase (GGDEF)-like protein
MATSLGVLFLAGGCLTLLSTVLPHPETLQETGAIVNSIIAIVAGLILFAVGPRLPAPAFQVFVGMGSILIAVGVHVGGYGAETPPYAFFYVWVAVYSFYFFERRAAVLQLGVGSLSHLTVLVLDGRGAVAITGWIFTWGITTVAGFVVGWLSLRVRTLAETDSLTGLRNRRAWDAELDRQLANAARTGQSFCVLLLDLDGLKTINDENGHQAGDLALKEAAAAWSGEIRAGDLIARLGGDEFGVLLPSCTPGGARALLERLRDSSEVRFSAGGAHWDGRESPQELLARADRDLYEAKSGFRDRPGRQPATPSESAAD